VKMHEPIVELLDRRSPGRIHLRLYGRAANLGQNVIQITLQGALRHIPTLLSVPRFPV
jgi:hypothetical protein